MTGKRVRGVAAGSSGQSLISRAPPGAACGAAVSSNRGNGENGVRQRRTRPTTYCSLASGRSIVCSDHPCEFAATGFLLDPAGDPGPANACCDRCGPAIAAEYNEKVAPGWTFRPGEIHGGLAARPPAAPEPPEVSSQPAEKEDCASLSCVVNRMAS